MKYLFGDATPFPLAENFLVTLCAATDACVAILRADELADEGNRLVREAEGKVTRELSQLASLARRVEDAFGPDPALAGPGNTPTEIAAAAICEQAWATIKRARAEVLSWRDAAVVSAAKFAPHAQVLAALSTFLTAHQLPDTTWSLRWRAGPGGKPPAAEIYGRTPFGLEVTFDVDIPNNHLWSRPVKLALLEKNATIRLTRKPWLRKPRPCPERLDKLFITSVTHTPDRASMTLRRSAKDPSEGVEIVLRSAADATDVIATRIGRDGVPIGSPELLTPDDVATVHRVWAQLETTISDLVCHRRRVTTAALGGVAVTEIAHPEAVAEALIDALAPLVRELAARSNTKGELALKRALGDGRREELFISYDTVLSRTTELSERHRATFDAFGLRERPMAVVRKLPTPPRPPKLRVVNG